VIGGKADTLIQQAKSETRREAEEAKSQARDPRLGQKPGRDDSISKGLQKRESVLTLGMAKAKMKPKNQFPAPAPKKTEVIADHILLPRPFHGDGNRLR
ncbi:hypothetical protein A6R68_13869, partial [Neotoma lepida]